MVFRASVLIFLVGVSGQSFAQTEPPQFMTVDGRLYDSTTPEDPLLDNSVLMKIQILNPAKTCILYEEEQTVSTLSSNGYFNVRVGSPTSGAESLKRTTSTIDVGNSMMEVFQNQNVSIAGKTSGGVGCGYTPAAGDTRYFRFVVTPSTTGVTSTLSPDMQIDSVPQSLVAETLQGMTPANFVQTNTDVTQAKVNTLFGASYTTLSGLLAGSSSLYLQNTTNGTVIPSRATNPASPTAGQIWYDSDDFVLRYYDGTSVLTLGTNGGDPTKLPLAGGTMAGAIDMATNDITDVGHVTQAPQRTFRFGVYTTAQQATLVATPLIAGHEGTVWYNTTTNKLMFWDGTAEYAVSPVDSVFGRTGAVVAAAGDYDANQIDNTAAGTIAATDVQAAINELDTEKVAKAGDTMTGALNIDNEQELRLSEADGSGANYVAIKALTTLGANYTLTLPATAGSASQVLTTDGSGVLSWTSLAAVGESNTASNQGVGGVGFYDAKSGVDLQFRNLNAASNKVSVALDAGNKEVDINVNEANFNSAAIPNTAAGTISATNVQAAINELDTEKVATTRAINTLAGSGLAGGGDLSVDRSLSVDINGTTAETVVAGNDEILIYDTSATALRKMTRTNFVLSEAEVDAMVANNGYLSAEADTLASVSGRGATTATSITLDAQAQARFADSAGGEYAAIQAPATIGTNYVLTLPDTAGASGQVLSTDGSGALSWINQFSVAADSLDFTHFTDAMTLDASTDITASGTNVLSITNTGSGESFRVNDQAADTSPFVIDAGGSVGIGTATPTNGLLDVNGDIAVATGNWFKVSNVNLLTRSGGSTVLRAANTDGIRLRTAGAIDAVIVDVVGNVGIGAATPGTLLDVAGAITSRPYGTATGETGQLIMRELAANGVNTASIRVPDLLAANYVLTLPPDDGSSGQYLQTDGNGILTWVTPAGVGETNTASNQGAGGVGVFKQKTTFDLEFRNINAASNKISVALDAGNNEIDINVDEANLALGNIPNTAAGTIAATNAQAAINELDTEKVAKAGDSMTGALTFGAQNQARFADSAGGEYAAIQAPATIATNYVLTLPTTAGSANQVLSTDGSGVLSWTDQSSFSVADDSLDFNKFADVMTLDASTEVVVNGTDEFSISNSSANALSYPLKLKNPAAGASSSTGILFQVDWGVNRGKGALVYSGDGTSWNRGDFYFLQNSAGGGANASLADAVMTIKNSGAVGIGTVLPGSKLDVAGAIASGPLGTSPGETGQFILRELAAGGTNSATLRAPDSLGADYVLTLPDTAGSASQVLTTNGSGVLSWTTPSTAPAADSLDFTHFADAMTLDASTDIAVSGTNVLSVTNSGTSDSFRVNDQAADTTPFVIDASGNVGIGTTTPGVSLDIVGGFVRSSGTSASIRTGTLLLNSSAAALNRGVAMRFEGGSNVGLANINGAWESGTGDDAYLSFDTRRTGVVTEAVRIASSGRVGIGTTVPGTILDASGAITSRPYGTLTGETGQLLMRELAASPGGTDTVAIRAPDSITTSYALTLPGTAGSASQVLTTDGAGILSWTTPSTTPGADTLDFTHFADAMTLDANTDIAASGTNVLSITNSGTGNSLVVNDQAADTTPFVIDASGNVGVGTTTPATLLDVSSATSGTLTLSRVDTVVTGGTRIGSVNFWNNDVTLTTQKNYAQIAVNAYQDVNTDAAAGNMVFSTTGTTAGGGLVNRMTIDGLGNVGIGASATPYVAGGRTLLVRSTNNQTAEVNVDSTGNALGANPYINFAMDGTRTAYITAQKSATSAIDAGLEFATHNGTSLTEKMRITKDGSVGVGTSIPGTLLDIAGAITSRPSGTGTGQTGQLLMRELAASPGGIDTVAIRAPDSITTSYALTLPGTAGSASQVLTTDGAGILSWTTPSTTPGADTLDFTHFADAMTLDASTDIAVSGANILSVTNSGTGDSFLVNDASGDTTPFVIDASGNVGIGTASTSNKIQVSQLSSGATANIAMFGNLDAGVSGAGARIHLSSSSSTTRSSYLEGLNTSGGTNAHALVFGTSAASSAPSEVMRMTSTGLGIGTTPSTRLHVSSGASGKTFSNNTGAIIENSGSLNTNFALQVSTSGAQDAFSITNAGNVGIGTTVPGTMLDAAGAITSRPFGTGTGQTGQLIMRELAASPGGTDTVAIRAPDSITTSYALTLPDTAGSASQVLTTNGAGILSWTTPSTTPGADTLDFTHFADTMTLDASTDIAASGTNVLSVTNSGTGDSFRVNDASGDTTPFVIDQSGNVGIGTTAPTMSLEIQGGASPIGANGIKIVSTNSLGANNALIEVIGRRNGAGGQGTYAGTIALAKHRDDNSILGASNSLGRVVFGGNHSTGSPLDILYSASIQGLGENTFTNSTTMPSALVFYTGSTGYTTAQTASQVGTERMRITSTGSIGIGTTIPGTLLDIAGAITSRPSGTGTGQTGQLIMRELAASPGGTDTVTLRAPDSVGTSFALTLPDTAGSSGQLLQTDGAGALSWQTVSVNGLLPSQTGNSGRFLSTDGTNSSWVQSNVDLLSDGILYSSSQFVGTSSGAAATGNFNAGFGYRSLQTMSTASHNTAVGSDALRLATNGSNTAVGALAGRNTSTGQQVTAVGRSALDVNTTGSYSTAVGTYALYAGNGDNNTALGASSLREFIAGTHNTAIGNQAGQGTSTVSSGSNNTLVGSLAGRNLELADNNTFLGYNTGTSVVNGDGNILIGNSANLTGDLSNKLNIGDTIYGDLATDAVGIGTSSPGTALDVVGAITSRPFGTATGETGQLVLRELVAGGSETVTVRAPDAIGTSFALTLPNTAGSSGQVLQTNGSGVLSWINAATSVAADALDFDKLSDTMTLDASTDISVASNFILSITNTGTGNSFVVNDQATDTSPFVIDAAGNVGIGVVSPTSKLEVSGRIVSSLTTDADALTALTVDFSNSNVIDATGASAACGTLNITNTVSGGSFTLTIPNATATCTTIQWNGSATGVKLPAGYAGGVASSGLVYSFLHSGSTLWVTNVTY